MDILETLATTYQINTQKPFFPVNTMRLFYLGLTQSLTTDTALVDRTNSAVPLISGLTDRMETARNISKVDLPELADLIEAIDSPWLEPALFALLSTLPDLVHHSASAYKVITEQPTLTPANLDGFLVTRALDSAVYAASVTAIISESSDQANQLLHPLTNTIRATLQLNDIVDALVHAEEDIKSGFAPIVSMLKKIELPSETTPKAFLESLLTARSEIAASSCPEAALEFVTTFTSRLVAAATGEVRSPMLSEAIPQPENEQSA